MMKIVTINPEFMPGDHVCPKINTELKFMVVGYDIHSVTRDGFVQGFNYRCADDEGKIHFFNELQITRSVINV